MRGWARVVKAERLRNCRQTHWDRGGARQDKAVSRVLTIFFFLFPSEPSGDEQRIFQRQLELLISCMHSKYGN